ncbi:hypothetical protein QTP88_008536 [Uroleucon formosanum]
MVENGINSNVEKPSREQSNPSAMNRANNSIRSIMLMFIVVESKSSYLEYIIIMSRLNLDQKECVQANSR